MLQSWLFKIRDHRALIQGAPPTELEACFRAYRAQPADSGTGPRFVSFDGKVWRGSFGHFQDQKTLHVLSAFFTDCRIIVAHEEMAEKTNEIPTAQTLITALGLSGYLFTLDALHCQDKTLPTAKASGNEVVVQVKENQKTFLADCRAIAETRPSADVYQEPVSKSRDRIESRQLEVFTQPRLTDADKWSLVEAVVKVERRRQVFDTRTKDWQQSDETSFYISATVLSAQEFCGGIRGRWGIENGDHYVRDVTMGEGRARIRTNPHLFAKLRSFALNILRVNHVTNVSLELFNNCMNLNNVLNYVGVR